MNAKRITLCGLFALAIVGSSFAQQQAPQSHTMRTVARVGLKAGAAAAAVMGVATLVAAAVALEPMLPAIVVSGCWFAASGACVRASHLRMIAPAAADEARLLLMELPARLLLMAPPVDPAPSAAAAAAAADIETDSVPARSRTASARRVRFAGPTCGEPIKDGLCCQRPAGHRGGCQS